MVGFWFLGMCVVRLHPSSDCLACCLHVANTHEQSVSVTPWCFAPATRLQQPPATVAHELPPDTLPHNQLMGRNVPAAATL